MSGGAGGGGHAKQMGRSVGRTGRKEIALSICRGESGWTGGRQSGAGLEEDGGRDGEQWGPAELGSSGNREGEEREEQRDRVRALLKVIGVSVRWPSAEESCLRTLIWSLQAEVGMLYKERLSREKALAQEWEAPGEEDQMRVNILS